MDTIRDRLAYLLGVNGSSPIPFPLWPPDMFAITADLLSMTDSYRRVVKIDDTKSLCPKAELTESLGRSWFERLVYSLKDDTEKTSAQLEPRLEPQLEMWWKTLTSTHKHPLPTPQGDLEDPLFAAIIGLFLAADQASETIAAIAKLSTRVAGNLYEKVFWLLQYENKQLSVCEQVSIEKLRVLPKCHTPDCGMTLRSLSHYLALVPNHEVTTLWVPSVPRELDTLNLLLVPWPMTLLPNQFSPNSKKHNHMSDKFGYFHFTKSPYANFREDIDQLIENSKDYVNGVHGIIFPELSLVHDDLEALVGIEAFICAGLGGEKNNSLVWSDFGDLVPFQRMSQNKHHRWFLESNQITRYGLGGVLSINKRWWEYTEISLRKLHCFNFNQLTICTLICEDLARQDPVAAIIRSLAPDMVISLLMDGPQLRDRWSALYAGVLADDPGCSVLTLTSHGMVELSNSTYEKKSRVVALWRDKVTGPKELSLGQKDQALLLTLTPTEREEVSADGREVIRKSALVYSGHHGITL